MSKTDSQIELDYRRVEQAIRFVETEFRRQPDLDEIAQSVHLSRYHFDRLFKRWAGVSPMQFLQYITLNYAKSQLDRSKSLLETTYDAGLSSPGRLHDLFVSFEAMSPGEYRSAARGMRIQYGVGASLFGDCLIATTDRGICHLGFVEQTAAASIMELKLLWPDATLVEAKTQSQQLVNWIFNPDRSHQDSKFHLHLKGTNFQVNVWRALLTLGRGELISYSDLSAKLNQPSATRAVASAVARNPVSFLIPCHRVISKSGAIHNYRWGPTRKKAIIGWEAAQRSTPA
jgi:AraC family transcriptional regulator of adaptative response/methylated-DNA-[protein]-cysteine methyltransferase